MAGFQIVRDSSTLSSTPLTVNFLVSGSATYGTDYTVNGATTYTATNGSVILPSGVLSVDIEVLPITDFIYEFDETIILTLTSVTQVYDIGSSSTGTITLVNDDPAPIQALSISISSIDGRERTTNSSSTATVTITRSTTDLIHLPLTVNLLISGTATIGVDYNLLSTDTPNSLTSANSFITIPPNTFTSTITLSTIGDIIPEDDETIVLTIVPQAGVSSGTGSVAWNVLDDDTVYSTMLLLHFDGANNSTIVDSSPLPIPSPNIVIYGTGGVSNTASKFGVSSLKLPIPQPSLTMIDLFWTAKFNLGVNFTIEGWYLAPGVLAINRMLYFRSNYCFLELSANGAITMRVTLAGVAYNATSDAGYRLGNLIAGWHHVACTKSGDTIRVFCDGVLQGSATLPSAAAIPFSSTQIMIGNAATVPTSLTYFDEIRVVNGKALYTSNFTPPTAALTVISS